MDRGKRMLRRRFLATSLALPAWNAQRKRYLTLAEARLVLAALPESLPAELRNADDAAWRNWAVTADRRIRDRVSSPASHRSTRQDLHKPPEARSITLSLILFALRRISWDRGQTDQ